MILGFTGTRHGMTVEQAAVVAGVMAEGWDEFHHGDCVGADAEAHGLAVDAGIRVVSHPPVDGRLRAWCVVDEQRAPLPYLARNALIVEACGLLVVCPAEFDEQQKGGTWWTWRHAVRLLHRRLMVRPDGSTSWVDDAHHD